MSSQVLIAQAKEFGASLAGVARVADLQKSKQIPTSFIVPSLIMRAVPRSCGWKTPEVKVMVGGTPVTQAWADKIGADGYAEDAIGAVAVAKKLVGA